MVHLLAARSIPAALVGQHPQKVRLARALSDAGQTAVLDHAADMQVFDHRHSVSLGYRTCCLVVAVPAQSEMKAVNAAI